MAVVQMQRDIRRVYVTEGDRPYDLPLRAWFNRSALCRQTDEQCNISLEFHFSDSRKPSNPVYVLLIRSLYTQYPYYLHSVMIAKSSVSAGVNKTHICHFGGLGRAKCIFTKRIVDLWNCLPTCVVKSPCVDSFKRTLDRFWCCQDVYYNCKATIAGTGNRITVM